MAALVPTPGPDYAAALAAAPPANLRRVGGEMFAWSDREPPLPRGPVLRGLLAELAGPGNRVLVAGPHHDELVTVLVDRGAEVTWLLRSLGDADEAAGRFPSVTVLAGAVGRLDPDVTYDLVVAADGVGRLNSTEGTPLTVPGLFDRLAAAVRPDGVLLLVHENHLGVHATVRLESPRAPDAAWYRQDDHDPERPASCEQLVARLGAAGLVVDAAYAAFPEPTEPTVLVGPGLLGEVGAPARAWLSVALSRAFAVAFRGRPVLSDPRRLVERAVRAGAEGVVAPAWLVVARGVEARPIAAEEILIFPDGIERAGLRRVIEAGVSGGGAGVRAGVSGGGAGVKAGGEPGPVSTGLEGTYLLGDRLLHLAAQADLRGLRRELALFDSWNAADLSDLSDILITPAGPTPPPVRWESIDPVPVETARIRAIWRFAVELITAGHPHPWPTTSSALDLTAIMLGMVDRSLTEADLRPAVELQVRLETAEFGLTETEQHARLLELLAVRPGTAPVDVTGYRELTEALWRQRYEASHLLAMMEWTERIIESRDSALSRMDLELQFYRSRWPGRFVMAARRVKRRLK